MKQSAFTFLLLCLLTTSVLGQDFKVPPYSKFKLKNGLTVYLMEQHEVPVINASVIIPAGATYDVDKAGLASLTATALKHGTRSYSKANLDQSLDFMGATIRTFASKESAGISAEFAAKDKQTAMNILKEILTAPTFDTTEFNKEKKQVISGLERSREQPRAVIRPYFEKLLFGDNPYGNILTGTISSVKMIQQADAKKFYQDNYSPSASAIAIAGDFNSAEMKQMVTSMFSSWTNGKPVVASSVASATLPTANKVLLVNKEDAKETTFLIGAPGVSRNNPDFVAISVINTAFGGRFTSWLNDELRVNSGLTYGASSSFVPYKKAGTFLISSFTATETTQPALDLALKVLDSLHKTGFDEKTLTSAKNYVKGQFPPSYETSGQLANLLTTMFWYDFDESFINNFQKNVNSLTADKAKEIVQKYFPADKLQFVLIGKSSEIKKIAEKYGTVTEVQIKEEPPKKAF